MLTARDPCARRWRDRRGGQPGRPAALTPSHAQRPGARLLPTVPGALSPTGKGPAACPWPVSAVGAFRPDVGPSSTGKASVRAPGGGPGQERLATAQQPPEPAQRPARRRGVLCSMLLHDRQEVGGQGLKAL